MNDTKSAQLFADDQIIIAYNEDHTHTHTNTYTYTNWRVTFYGGWYENKLSEMFFHCCLNHLSALTFFVYTDFLKVFTSFVKNLYIKTQVK
jgi:hypothetical protein